MDIVHGLLVGVVASAFALTVKIAQRSGISAAWSARDIRWSSGDPTLPRCAAWLKVRHRSKIPIFVMFDPAVLLAFNVYRYPSYFVGIIFRT